MTVSFTLPYEACANTKVSVSYGRGWFPEGHASVSERVDFQYDASVVVPNLTDYQSDWIHHWLLTGLEAGRQQYWYRIVVVDPLRTPVYATTGPSHYLRGGSLIVGETPVYSFLTPPVPHQPTALALVGDLGDTTPKPEAGSITTPCAKGPAFITIGGWGDGANREIVSFRSCVRASEAVCAREAMLLPIARVLDSQLSSCQAARALPLHHRGNKSWPEQGELSCGRGSHGCTWETIF